MGYDLKGEGFVTENLEDGDQIDVYAQGEPDPTYYADEQEPDPQQGVMRASDGTVSYIKSDPIYKYIVNDNLCYIIRNENSNLSKATDTDFWGALWNVISFPFRAGASELGTGLIGLFWEDDLGEAGGYVSAWNDIANDIKVDSETKKLRVVRGWTNKGYTFDLDGWTGRYGKPLEFLLSVFVFLII